MCMYVYACTCALECRCPQSPEASEFLELGLQVCHLTQESNANPQQEQYMFLTTKYQILHN